MVVVGVISSALVRAVKQFAADDDTEEDTHVDTLRVGVILGTKDKISDEDDGDNANTNRVSIWGVVKEKAELEEWEQYVPCGINEIGRFGVLYERDAAANSDKLAAFAGRLLASDTQSTLKDQPFVLVYVHATQSLHLFQQLTDQSSCVSLELQVLEYLHARDFHQAINYNSLRCALDFDVPPQSDIKSVMERWKSQLTSPSTQLFFRFGNNTSIFNGVGVDVTKRDKPSQATSTISSVLNISTSGSPKKQSRSSGNSKSKKTNKKKAAEQRHLDTWDDEGSSSKRSGSNPKSGSFGAIPSLEYGDISNIDVLCSLSPSPEDQDNEGRASAPILTIPSDSLSNNHASIHIHCDVFVVLPLQATIMQTLELVRDQLRRQLDRMEKLEASSVNEISAHHFALRGAAFPLTLISSSTTNDRAKESTTKELYQRLHSAFLQSLNQPLFHADRCSLVRQAAILRQSDVLFNVHEGIPSSGVQQGQQYLVTGFYGYYHYMQQNINDKGWGCAYRSLQTLASWLFLNHYTQKQYITHQEIQRTLVKIGDKPASFVNSREWIGSMEVGYVLDELFGVSFRNLNVGSGPQLVEKAQDLKHHFMTQGTPVMMGGGSLAFTVLGIDYNESTGDCAFLILDPHYVGTEDLDIIQTKTMALEGYKAVPCGWRKANSFAKNSFYNLCLPQRPQTIQ